MLVGTFSVFVVPAGYAAWRLVKRHKHSPLPPHGKWVLFYAVGAMLWMLDLVSLLTDAFWPSIISWILD